MRTGRSKRVYRPLRKRLVALHTKGMKLVRYNKHNEGPLGHDPKQTSVSQTKKPKPLDFV